MNAKDFFCAIIPQLARFVQKNFFSRPIRFERLIFFCRVLTNELWGGYAIQNSASSVCVSSFHVVRADSFKNFCKEVKRMPVEDKKIKHFILSRLFTFQRVKYPYNVLDVDFLSKQLPLAKNMLDSLENQTNKNFDLVFMANEKFFEDPKYEFVFSTLKNSTSLPLKFIRGRGDKCKAELNPELLDLLKASLNEYDFVITTRMDFDDFIFKNAVAEAQSKVDECENILAYGYNNGYEYFYGDLYPYRTAQWVEKGHLGIFQSLILKSSSVKELPYFSVENFSHNYIKQQLKQFLEDNGTEFSENMFQQNISAKAYIYFRHEFSQENLAVHGGRPFTNPKKKITTADITKEQLADEFGFHYELKSIE